MRILSTCFPVGLLLAFLPLSAATVTAATLLPSSEIPELRESADLSDGQEAMRRKDYPAALLIFTRKADSGNAAALFALGYMHQHGLGVDASAMASETFYRQAAKLGNVAAMHNLAVLLVARPGSVAEGTEWLTKAAEKGSGRAALAMGRLITDGPNAKTQAADAESWFRKAVQAPELKEEAAFTLAVFLDPTLTGTDARSKEGRKFLESSAEAGYQPAVLALSDALLRTKEGARAVEVLKKGDAAGSTEATFRLASLNFEGRVIPANPVEALRLYTKAAEAGHPAACNQLASLYQAGKGGVAADPVKAWEWFLKAATLGLPMGQFNAGVCLEDGLGVAKNPAGACQWYCQSALSGYAPAQNRLGLRYQEGQGVLKDPVAARAWLREAAMQGFEAAMLNYASMLAGGQGGPRDIPNAVTLYKSLAGKNHPDALHGLGLLMESGLAGPADPPRALALQQLAADRNPAAKARAEALLKVLSPEDKTKAAAYVKDPRTLFPAKTEG
ncbi:MAG: sel1 repeat family protein [Verrucomicrobiaceae bacterium]|nr:MAG: sel1 repeat family protein [Verrucomicrobiaceae bacterium]